MKRNVICLLFLFFIQQNLAAQPPQDHKQQFAMLGNFPLENGQQIIDCKIGYRTFGKLNASRSNTVIYPTGGGGTTYMMETFFGVGTDVDTTKFFLILIDALGNGVSSSPSNSQHQPKTKFPEFTITDMVRSQYQLLTEKLQIKHLVAVVGGSMGGFQALQWAVSYPDFMDKVVAIDASPKLSTYDLLWMTVYMEAIKIDPAYQGGNYSGQPVLPLSAHLMQLFLTSPAAVNNTVPADSFYHWLPSIDRDPLSPDANDFLWQVKACIAQDISKAVKGSLENAARVLKAKMLIIANAQDRLVNQAAAISFAKLAKAELVVMDNALGHLIFNEKIPIEATRRFLEQ